MMANQTTFLYLNANHCQGSTLNAVAVADARNVNIFLLTEPYHPTYHPKIQVPWWDAICGPRSAILVRKDITHATQPLPHVDVVAARIGGHAGAMLLHITQ